MSHELIYESVSGFSPTARIRVRVGVGFRVRVRVRVRVTGVFLLRFNILTYDSLTDLNFNFLNLMLPLRVLLLLGA